jgi:hypothetical protein
MKPGDACATRSSARGGTGRLREALVLIAGVEQSGGKQPHEGNREESPKNQIFHQGRNHCICRLVVFSYGINKDAYQDSH